MAKTKIFKLSKLILVIFVLLVAVFTVLSSGADSFSYVVDDGNTCTWEDGEVMSATAVPPEARLFDVSKDLEENYLADSAENKVCTAKRNDNSTEYSAFINEAYDLYVTGEADPSEKKLESSAGGFVVE